MSANTDQRDGEPLIDVPDDFEGFDEARRKPSTTPEHERRRCPDCGSVDIARKSRGPGGVQRKEGDWRCESCDLHFNEPADGVPREQRALTDFGGRRR